MTPADISVVIPAINEEASVGRSVRSAREAGATDVIVVDGGSEDSTTRMAMDAGASKIVRSLSGPWHSVEFGSVCWPTVTSCCFLHADNELGEALPGADHRASRCDVGSFSTSHRFARTVFRADRVGQMQCESSIEACRLAIRRSLCAAAYFNEQGGFAEIPLMEDVELGKRLRKLARPLLLEGPLTISPRRWEKHGVLRQTFRNWSIQLSYARGASPGRACGDAIDERLRSTGSRVRSFVDLTQIRGADVGVDLGGRQTLVTQQFLNAANVGAAVEQVSREAVTQRVGTGSRVQARRPQCTFRASGPRFAWSECDRTD